MHVVSEANLMNKCEIDLYQSATNYFGLLWIFGYEWSLEVHCPYNSQYRFTGTETVQYEKTTSKI